MPSISWILGFVSGISLGFVVGLIQGYDSRPCRVVNTSPDIPGDPPRDRLGSK